MTWLERLFLNFALMVLERLLEKGTAAWQRYRELTDELKRNAERATDYQRTVNDDQAGREARRRAEDELLG